MLEEASNQLVNILFVYLFYYIYIYISTFIGRKNINLTAYAMLYRLLKFRMGNT